MPTGDRKLDAFASMFRSALKDVFHLKPPTLSEVAFVSDFDEADTAALEDPVRTMLGALAPEGGLQWRRLPRERWVDVEGNPIPTLLRMLQDEPPHLLVTWRHLLGAEKDLPHTLGSAVDTLTQATDIPVLLLPPPNGEAFRTRVRATERVMAVTDHLQGDDRLVNWAVTLTRRKGTLYLAHVEDDATLAHYLRTIGRIPGIDSELAEREIPRQLLDRPTTYIRSIVRALKEHRVEEEIVPVVRMGHALTDYKALVQEHDIDLLVMNTKDERQLAMKGMAHALAVELRDRPLLLL